LLEINNIFNNKWEEISSSIEGGSVDLILTDPPYNITGNKWDTEIDLNKLWSEYLRIIKSDGNIVITASQPFTTGLINSKSEIFRYNLVWDKVGTAGFLTANKRPLQRHEDICIFYKNLGTYNPQMEIRGKPRKKGGYSGSTNYDGVLPTESFNNEYFPTSILSFSNASQINKFHPTQKPVELFSYLIKTYSNEGDLVFDNYSGSGTTAISALETKRNYICIEKDLDYYTKSIERVKQWHKDQLTIFDIM
jgi:site-specific DNA-methyltransferase (adenine-specific)